MSETLKVDGSRLLTSIGELAEIGRTPEGGVTRLCLSSADVEAKHYVIGLMKGAGLEVYIDRVSNVIGALGSDLSERPVVAGSHTDSVINGGRLDGSYGVLAAIEALRAIKEKGIRLRHPVVAVSFANEEGIRFPSMTGSRYISSQLTEEQAYSTQDSEGISYGAAMRKSGLTVSENAPRWSGGGSSARGGGRARAIDSYVELHIEQGPLLERSRKDVGVVQNIVGIVQYEVEISGSDDHAGTTPMSARYDALVAASKVVLEVRRLTNRAGHGAVGTVGRLVVSPGAPNVVPGKVRLSADFRNASLGVLHAVEQEFGKQSTRVAKKSRVKIDRKLRARLQPTRMSRRIAELIESQSESLGLSMMRMNSGAGHDCMIMRRICDAGMIFVASKRGKSHSPLEATGPEQIVNGANVLANVLVSLAS